MQQKINEISMHVSSDLKVIAANRQEWSSLIALTSKSPFYLIEYLKEFMETVWNNGDLVIISFRNNQSLVGAAILQISKGFMGGRASFIHQYWCSDFLFMDGYRDKCFELTFNYIFRERNCKFAYFDLPRDSLNFGILIKKSKSQKMFCRIKGTMGHRVIPLDSNWAEYRKKRTRTFRKTLFRIERNLNLAGKWSTVRVENGDEADVFEKISKIERRSWKHKYWEERKSSDKTLAVLLKAAPLLAKKEQDFKMMAWFLVLNDEPIAYQFAYVYMSTAYFLKTSFDQQYQKLSPGIFIMNTAIRELMDEKKCTYIDFITDYKYMQSWTKTSKPRISVILAKGRIANTFQTIYENPIVNRVLYKLISK